MESAMAIIIPFAPKQERQCTRALIDQPLEGAGDTLLRFDELRSAVADSGDAIALMKHLMAQFPGQNPK
jgi:hypothetical protein